MNNLSSQIEMNIIKRLQSIGEDYKNGDYDTVLKELENFWEEIPTPKENILNSYRIVDSSTIVALRAKRLNIAKQWAERALPYNEKINLMGESEFLAGEVCFARGELEEASEYFELVRKKSGWRLFKDENPEYRNLIEQKKCEQVGMRRHRDGSQ